MSRAAATIERSAELEWTPGPEARDGANQPRRPSRGEQAIVWTFGILELLLEVTSQSLNLARNRIQLIRQITHGEARR